MKKQTETMNAAPVALWHNPREVEAPRELSGAAVALETLAGDVNCLIDDLSNDTAANYQAVIEAVATCRNALARIEARAMERLILEAEYHRENLESIEALNVPLQSVAVAA